MNFYELIGIFLGFGCIGYTIYLAWKLNKKEDVNIIAHIPPKEQIQGIVKDARLLDEGILKEDVTQTTSLISKDGRLTRDVSLDDSVIKEGTQITEVQNGRERTDTIESGENAGAVSDTSTESGVSGQLEQAPVGTSIQDEPIRELEQPTRKRGRPKGYSPKRTVKDSDRIEE